MSKNGFMSKCFEKFKKNEDNKILEMYLGEKNVCSLKQILVCVDYTEFYEKKMERLSRKIKLDLKKLIQIVERINKDVKEKNGKNFKIYQKEKNLEKDVDVNLEKLQEIFKGVEDVQRNMKRNTGLFDGKEINHLEMVSQVAPFIK